MLFNDVGSRNVYENKQNHDELSLEKSDIYVEVARILQKMTDSGGQYAANDVFGGDLCGNSADKYSLSSTSRRGSQAVRSLDTFGVLFGSRHKCSMPRAWVRSSQACPVSFADASSRRI